MTVLTHGKERQTSVDGSVGEAEKHGEAQRDHDPHADGTDANTGQATSLSYTRHFVPVRIFDLLPC